MFQPVYEKIIKFKNQGGLPEGNAIKEGMNMGSRESTVHFHSCPDAKWIVEAILTQVVMTTL